MDGAVDGVVGVLRLLQAVSVSARMTPRMWVARPTGPAFRKMRDDGTNGRCYPSPFRASTCPHAEHLIGRSAPENLTTGKTTQPSARVAGAIRSRNVGLAACP